MNVYPDGASSNKYSMITGIDLNEITLTMIAFTMTGSCRRCSAVAILNRTDILNIDAKIVAKANMSSP
jgi:hypothetical protein